MSWGNLPTGTALTMFSPQSRQMAGASQRCDERELPTTDQVKNGWNTPWKGRGSPHASPQLTKLNSIPCSLKEAVIVMLWRNVCGINNFYDPAVFTNYFFFFSCQSLSIVVEWHNVYVGKQVSITEFSRTYTGYS